MTRAPFQVFVYPYRVTGESNIEYALLRRSDAGYWQAVAGGGEVGETPLQAARREANEEAGIPPGAPFLQLETVESVPVTEFRESHLWGEDIYVIPQYYFGALVEGVPLTRSHEHTEHRWLTYPQARRLLKYDSDRVALWELHQKLRGLGPRDQGSQGEDESAAPLKIHEATRLTDELVAALERLVPQLTTRPVPTPGKLAEILASPCTTVYIARHPDFGDEIVGTLTLTLFRVPTGLRGWIEDLVVDERARGRGIGAALVREALRCAAEAGAGSVGLTSNPSRRAANRLYLNLGFEQRHTNVYHYTLG